jgi:hypothetical protein
MPNSKKQTTKKRTNASTAQVSKSKLKVAKGKGNGKTTTHRDYIPAEARITKLVKENPRREGTIGHESFSVIKSGMTVEQYVAKGGRRKDLRWDLDHEYVKLETKAS